jgi:GNAT superfamily N-acetyltransferase
MAVEVRLGGPEDVEAAVSVYERSNLVRRRGQWPSRATRLAHVTANLCDAASWFLLAHEGSEAVAMALVLPFRADRGAGAVVPRTSFLDLIYVLPDRWGRGIGKAVLDAVIAEAARRESRRIYLWTHERDNERAQRLYLGRGFSRTGTTGQDDSGEPVAEWLRDG